MKRVMFAFSILLFAFTAYADGQKISAMTELAADPASDDEIAIVDTSETETKRITWSTIESNIVASAGDNATAFFSDGTIEHERGGLEADVSAYDGLVKISGGSTSAATIGIADNNIVEIDSADVADDEYARFTANGLESRTPAEMTGDLSEVSDSAQGVVPSTSGASDGYAVIVQGDGSLAYEALGAVGVGKHMAKMSRAAAQTLTNDAETKIAFDTEDFDMGGLADYTTNDRFDIQRDGKYLVVMCGYVPGVDDGERIRFHLYKNGSSLKSISHYNSANGQNTRFCSPYVDDFNAGEYLEFYIYHNEGANVDTATGSPDDYPSMSVVQLDGVASGDRGPVSVTCSDVDDTCAYAEGFGSYYLTSGADATPDVMTISDGFAGQKAMFRMEVDGGDDISVEFTNGTDCDDFEAAGDFCFAEFDGTNWFIIAQN